MDRDFGATNIDAISTSAQATLQDLKKSGGKLADFAGEFEKLYEVVVTSNTREAALAKSAHTLIDDIDSHKSSAVELATATEELTQTEAHLSSEVADLELRRDKILLSITEKREHKAGLRERIEQYEASLALGSGWTKEQTAQKLALEKQIKDLNSRVESVRSNLVSLRRDQSVLQSHIDKGQDALGTIEEAKIVVQQTIDETISRTAKLTKAKEGFDGEMRGLQAEIDGLHGKIADRTQQIRTTDSLLHRQELALKQKTQEVEKVLKRYAIVHKDTTKATDDLDAQMVTNQGIANELNDIETATKRDREDLRKERSEIKKNSKLADMCREKMDEIDRKVLEVEETKAGLENEKAEVRRLAEREHQANAQLTRGVADLQKEKEILEKSIGTLGKRCADAETLIRVQMGVRKTIDGDITGYRASLRDLRDKIDDGHEAVAKEEDHMVEVSQRVASVDQQLKLQDLQIQGVNGQLEDSRDKLRKQQTMYEAVRTDRNKYQKSLVALEDQISEISQSFKGTMRQVDQLKDEITNKDHKLVNEHFGHHKVEKEKDAVKNELGRVNRLVQSSSTIIVAQAAETTKLTRILQEAEEESRRQEKELKAVEGEKDVLRGQLTQREEELSQLYEKLKIQRSMLDNGGAHYAELSAQQDACVKQLAEAKSELMASKLQVTNVDKLKHECLLLEKDLTKEKARVTALANERERPMNIHRWRFLENAKPHVYALIQRLQALQKRVIAAEEEVEHRNRLIAEKEKLYMELKTLLARQPGPEITEQLSVYQQTLKQKTKQLRAMNVELEMYKGAVSDHKYEIEKISKELSDLKTTFFRANRGGRARRETAAAPVDYLAGNLWDEGGSEAMGYHEGGEAGGAAAELDMGEGKDGEHTLGELEGKHGEHKEYYGDAEAGSVGSGAGAEIGAEAAHGEDEEVDRLGAAKK